MHIADSKSSNAIAQAEICNLFDSFHPALTPGKKPIAVGVSMTDAVAGREFEQHSVLNPPLFGCGLKNNVLNSAYHAVTH
jgi:hypothetical protein